jgi:Tol biopolymer transport system component
MKRLSYHILCAVLFLSAALAEQRSQTFSVNGNVKTVERPVSYASVTFIDKSDSTKRYSTVTDTSGNYRLDVTTRVTSQVVLTPQGIELEQNYPNPFSSSTAISYKLNRHSDVNIRIYNILGQEIKAWIVGSQTAGTHGLLWDGRDNFGKKVSLGIYFYQLQAGNETHVKKMVFGFGGMNANASILQSGPSQTLEKASTTRILAGTFAVQIENFNCTTTPQVATKQFDNIAVQSDTTLNFVVAPAAAQPPSPVYPAPYSSVVWHPDGRIAFNWTKILKINRCTGGVNEKDIDWDSSGFWMINSDGAGLHRLLSYSLGNAAWSPDGEWIVFDNLDAQIYKMRFTGTTFDTTTLAQLTTGGENSFPTWSPDGLWIAYDRSVADFSGPSGGWIMRSDGTGKRFVFKGYMLDWAPDGVHLAYVGLWSEIYRVNITDTTQVVRLTSFNQVDPYARDNRCPRYSPDGTKIAFSSQASGEIPQLWIMNADGTNLQQLTTPGAESFSWSPDSAQIAYVQHDARKADVNNGTLWIMNADGSNKRQLTFNYNLVFEP